MRVAIRVEKLGKLYRLGGRVPYRSVREALARASSRAVRRLRGRRVSDAGFVWALKDVSFEVTPGEVVGIVGANGVGKSTLLKLLSRITEPTEGQGEIHGRVGTLLEVGTGFHPELTGRENIQLSGAILGMRKHEIATRFDQIVDFAGVERFLDTPLKHYSSGMYIRLAFAVAAHLEPEILLVDEVLAVGDAAFQEKCLGKMAQVARSGRTVLFVSHNLSAVRNLCSRALLLEQGRLRLDDTPDEVIQAYMTSVGNARATEFTRIAPDRERYGHGRVRVVSFAARTPGAGRASPATAAEAEFVVSYRGDDPLPLTRLNVGIAVVDTDGTNLFVCSTGMYYSALTDVPSSGQAVCRVPSLPLIPGRYWVSITLKDDVGVADQVDKAACFSVVDGGKSGVPQLPSRRWGSVLVPHEWEWRPAAADSR